LKFKFASLVTESHVTTHTFVYAMWLFGGIEQAKHCGLDFRYSPSSHTVVVRASARDVRTYSNNDKYTWVMTLS